MDLIWKDLRTALRVLRREPAYAAACVAILALGIGVATTVFSVLSGVLLDPLPYPDAHRLTMVWNDNRNQGWPEDVTSYTNYLDWKSRNTVFQEMGAFRPRSLNLTGEGDPRRVRGAAVTADFFEVMGVEPLLGRVFGQEEEQFEADRSVVLSHGFWTREWGNDPKALGRRIVLSGHSFQVVGVMPPQFDFPQDVELWTPLAPEQDLREARGALWLHVIGRLKTNLSLETAQAEMSRIAADLEREYPDVNEGYGINLEPLLEELVGEVRLGLVMLMAAVGLVVLIAVANLAGLGLVRAVGRRWELAVRSVLGARRLQLIRQILIETLILSLLGGALGLGMAYLAVQIFPALGPPDLPRLDRIGVDSTVVWFALAVSLLAGLAVGLLPALQASGVEVSGALRGGGRGLGKGGAGQVLRKALVVSEVALALVLLAGAMLLVRSLLNLQRVDPGFDPSNLLTVNLSTSGARYAEASRRTTFYQQFEERVRGLPGVRSAGSTSALFIPLLTNSTTFSIEGRPALPRRQLVEVPIDAVTPRFFETLGVRLISGRQFAETDSRESPPVVIINETMARQFWPDEDPVGQRIKYGAAESDSVWRTIVGVVSDVRRSGLDRPVRPSTFLPHAQHARLFMTAVIRTESDPAAALPAVRSAVRELDPELPVFNVGTVEETLAESMSERRFHMTLLTLFSALALVLAVSGLYGVVSYSASQRTREIGVRLALGAGRREILKLVLREGMALTVTGIVLGLAGAVALTRFMESLLFGVNPGDAATLATMVALVALAALAACGLPAARASRIDPARALHYE